MDGTLQIGPTKTACSLWPLPLVLAALRAHRERQAQERAGGA
ncbi:hypothetical protein ABTY61_26770 [Kitasatospora sp. NPDC096128]